MTIPGLRQQEEYVSVAEQDALLACIEQQPWLTDLKRRVQHYGYRYNYSRRSLNPSQYLGPLPAWLASLAQRLQHEGITPNVPDQVIINEYMPGQGISAHIDCIPCFSDTIVSISLLSPCVMIFSQPATETEMPVLVAPRSLLVMQDDARYTWKHAIMPRKVDMFAGQAIPRQRRISLTLRTVLHEH